MKTKCLCVICWKEFTTTNPCCCDNGIYADGSHKDGVCIKCHKAEHPPYVRRDGVDGYEVNV